MSEQDLVKTGAEKATVVEHTTLKPRVHQAIISVGSNIDPYNNIPKSLEVLSTEPQFVTRFVDCADVIETNPVGYTDQPNFLNTAYLVETSLELDAFNRFLKTVEDGMGRLRGPVKSGPRTIDLDIIVWNGELLGPDYHQFEYVSVPVDQILSANQLTLR